MIHTKLIKRYMFKNTEGTHRKYERAKKESKKNYNKKIQTEIVNDRKECGKEVLLRTYGIFKKYENRRL